MGAPGGAEGEPCLFLNPRSSLVTPACLREGHASSRPRAGVPVAVPSPQRSPEHGAAPGLERLWTLPAPRTRVAPGTMAPARPAGSASGRGAARGLLLLLFPFGMPLAGRRASHLVACPQDPPPGEGQGAAQPGGGAGPARAAPRELPGTPSPASPRELPRKAELLVKGSRRVPPAPSLPPARVGPEAAAPLALPGAMWGHSWQRRGGCRGWCQGTDRWLPHVQVGGAASPSGARPAASVSLRLRLGSSAAQKHADTHNAPATPFSFP